MAGVQVVDQVAGVQVHGGSSGGSSGAWWINWRELGWWLKWRECRWWIKWREFMCMVDQVAGVQVVDQVAGVQVVVQVTGAQVVDQVAGVQVVDQVAGNQKSEIRYLAHWPTIISAYKYTYNVNGPWVGRLPKDCNISRYHGSHPTERK